MAFLILRRLKYFKRFLHNLFQYDLLYAIMAYFSFFLFFFVSFSSGQNQKDILMLGLFCSCTFIKPSIEVPAQNSSMSQLSNFEKRLRQGS